MAYKEGNDVIVNVRGTNQVGKIIKKFIVNKNQFYDILLESRSCITCVNTAKSKNIYIDNSLTKMLIDTEVIKSNIPYADLVETDMLPYTR